MSVVSAPAPAHVTPSTAFPANWVVVASAAEWFEHHYQAVDAGAMLATVFVSDKAARAHASLLERLRCNFGAGADAPVRFVFVHIGDDYHARHARATTGCAAAAASGLGRSAASLTLGRVSHIAALHGLDVALTSFLPDGVRAFPSLLLTAGPVASVSASASIDGGVAAAPWSWSAATRVGELTQLVSDWAFIIKRCRTNQIQIQQSEQQERRLGHNLMAGVVAEEKSSARWALAGAAAVVVDGPAGVALEERAAPRSNGATAPVGGSFRRTAAAVLVTA